MPDLTADQLPLRVAQVTHALLETLAEAGDGPVATAEVYGHDRAAVRLNSTAVALGYAATAGLATGALLPDGMAWHATRLAWSMRRALEDRVAGQEAADDPPA